MQGRSRIRRSGTFRSARSRDCRQQLSSLPVTSLGDRSRDSLDLFCTEPTIVQTIGDARARRPSVLDVTAPAPMRPLIAAALCASTEHGGGPSSGARWSAPRFAKPRRLTAALQSLVGEEAVAYYPAWGDVAARATESALRLRSAAGSSVLRRLAAAAHAARRRGSSSHRYAASFSPR